MRIKISFIIPCYFNEANIPVTVAELIKNEELFGTEVDFEYVMIDDGSKDNTFDELLKFQNAYKEKVKVIKLTKNVGSHNAVFAGLNYTTGNCIVILAADLQDPPELVYRMLEYWKKGIKIVIANREEREDKLVHKIFSNLFHYLIRKFAIQDIPKGGYDLILFDSSIRDHILRINEKNTNITYLISWLGYDFVNIPYKRRKRQLGKSKWTLQKKIKLLIDSFVAFSYLPLRFISVIGIIIGLGGFAYILFLAIYYIFYSSPVPGWSSLMVAILFMGSLQLLGLGILGEYLWRTLDEVRRRPSYIVDKVISEDSQ